MNWEEWKNTKAADRIRLHDEIADAFIEEGLMKKLTPKHHTLLRELAFGSSRHCDCCEEPQPEVMMYDGCENDDDWEDGIESDIVGDYEWSVCACCVQSKREETMCENCGSPQWMIRRAQRDEQGRHFFTATPCTRLVNDETVEFPEHTMRLSHPYKEASE